ncbi:MAG: hypothetical protein QOJ26_795, partial [Thermoplasmata archaeon]|nr:hypothetical protein [Thermoplasmata archaeon]
MRSAWAIMTIVACAGLAGCAERFDEARPDDWQQGAPLMAYIGGKGHDAGEQYWLRPPNGTEAPTPARCVAYQGGRHAT